MSDLVLNHDEALQLAHLRKADSNLARCYIDQADEIIRLREALEGMVRIADFGAEDSEEYAAGVAALESLRTQDET